MNTQWTKNSFVYLLIIISVLAIFFTFFQAPSSRSNIPVSQVIQMAKDKEIRSIKVDLEILEVEDIGGRVYKSRKEDNTPVIEMLENAGADISGIEIEVEGASGFGSLLGLLINFLPLIFFGAIILFMMRQAQGSNNQTLSFGRSKAKMFVGNKVSVTFADVAGIEEAKQELHEVVEFLRYPERFAALGAKIPKGVLLVGPPGTGKTLLGRAVAGEAGVPFFSISGSEFVEMFVGVGASRVRDLFDQAKRNSPCIIFIDEIDAVGRHRGAGLGGGHDEREQTLNQILVEMDGFDTTVNIIILAATNRPDILDPALLRPGRFDRRVMVDSPDINGRDAILNVHAKGKPLASEVDLTTVAQQTPGYSGADLANLINEAAILTARRGAKEIGQTEFAEAIDRVIAGPQRKSRVISDKEKEMTAYHEAGHALVAHLLPNADPVQKISIIARGAMGGYTRLLPTEERYLMRKEQFTDMLATALGGRVAEELTFDAVTTGASNDIENATNIARQMITRYGMSESLGPRTFGKKEDMIFLGREISEQRDYSDKIAEEIDEEVHKLIQSAYEQATEILKSNKSKLAQIANYLVVNETVEGKELNELFESDPSNAEVSEDTI
ncbi:MAG: ATP-dependent zinc metalloprotease FtsH [Dehalococcoidia bacterium]|nr:ATP-dependent zinc metalloprotease FtsH [Dehalococcoidia bacterium]